jgi:hypothetical protein
LCCRCCAAAGSLEPNLASALSSACILPSP